MNKKTKTDKPVSSISNLVQQQMTNTFIDERGEHLLPSSSMAGSAANCSPTFRPSTGTMYQINNKNDFEHAREVDVNRSSMFHSPLSADRDLVQCTLSPHSEILNNHQYQPSSTDRPTFSPSIGSTADRRTKHFIPAASPDVTTSILQGHLLPNSMSFAVTSVFSQPRPTDSEIPKRTKLLHSFVERSLGISDNFSLINSHVSNNVVNLSNNMHNIVPINNNNNGCTNGQISMLQGNIAEIKKEPSYRPEVEAISPTASGDELSQNDVTIRHSKDEILQNITRLDRMISSFDQKVVKLRRLREHLEEKPCHPPEENVERPISTVDFSKLGIAHSIYSENRVKALESHQFVKMFGLQLSLPLYQKPSDVQIYHDNINKFASFKPLLIAYIKKRKLFEMKRDLYLCRKYDRLSENWVRRMDRIENNPKKRAKDAKTREAFEKVFPELRRKREEKDRMTKMSKKSDTDSTGDPEEDEVRTRMTMAAEPPIMLNSLSRKRAFLSENGRIYDNFELGQMLPGIKKFYWAKTESDIFRETYVANPKNFARIASQLQNKTIQDCVYFYYVTKKEEGYKLLVRRHNMSRRKHDKAKKAHKEVKEEKAEEAEDTKDLKFLPSSPAVAAPTSSSASSMFTYQFKLPNYLLLPNSASDPTVSSRQSVSSSPMMSSPSLLSSLTKKKISSPLPSLLVSVKQEPDCQLKPPPSPSSLLSSLPTSCVDAPMLPVPVQASPADDSPPHVLHSSSPLPSSIVSSHFHSSCPSSQLLTSPAILETSKVTSVSTSQVAEHHPQPHVGSLPPPHAGGSIVQGTPVVVSHNNELTAVWQHLQQQIQLQLLQQQLQQQFHQQHVAQQRQQQMLRTQHDQLPFSQPNLSTPSIASQDLKTLVNQLAANQPVQELRGSIIKGTPNHVIQEVPVGSVVHQTPTSVAPLANRVCQDRGSPADSRNSPKRSSGKSKVFSRNENNPARTDGGLPGGPVRMEGGLLGGPATCPEESNRIFEHSREILIDDFMTAQKMNSQQKTITSAVPSYGSGNYEHRSLKKQTPVSLKRKATPSSSLPQPGEGMIYFAGMDIPKNTLPQSSPSMSSESARTLIDTIICQNINSNEEEWTPPKKLSSLAEGARPITPLRSNPNFQPPVTPPMHFFPTSCSPQVAALQSSMILKSLLPPYFPSGSLANLPLLQSPFQPIYPTPSCVPCEKVPSTVSRSDPSNFTPGLSSSSSSRSLMGDGTTSAHISHNGSTSSKANSRGGSHSVGPNVVTSTPYSAPASSLSSAMQPAFPRSSSCSTSQSSWTSSALSSSSSGFHPPASFLQMFPLGQFMSSLSSFPLRIPQPASSSSSRHQTPPFIPPSSLFMTQLNQNFHQQMSGGAPTGLPAVSASAPKSTSTTSGHG